MAHLRKNQRVSADENRNKCLDGTHAEKLTFADLFSAVERQRNRLWSRRETIRKEDSFKWHTNVEENSEEGEQRNEDTMKHKKA